MPLLSIDLNMVDAEISEAILEVILDFKPFALFNCNPPSSKENREAITMRFVDGIIARTETLTGACLMGLVHQAL